MAYDVLAEVTKIRKKLASGTKLNEDVLLLEDLGTVTDDVMDELFPGLGDDVQDTKRYEAYLQAVADVQAEIIGLLPERHLLRLRRA